ncbi:hypothetical protein [uncultured Acidaminococcus sp.]|uniref:hypothetical protein n=1 Tax=uncultured Acidaminococcus sp. TaxID=352152 RepID=UPI00265DF872|nr:hypothetical protein [uncultured Acidaminococcus sp.]
MPDSAQNRREMFYRFDRQFTDSTSLTLSYAHFSNSRGLWLGRSYWDTHRENYEAEKLANNKKNLAEGQVLSSGPRLITRDPRPQEEAVAHATAPFTFSPFPSNS